MSPAYTNIITYNTHSWKRIAETQTSWRFPSYYVLVSKNVIVRFHVSFFGGGCNWKTSMSLVQQQAKTRNYSTHKQHRQTDTTGIMLHAGPPFVVFLHLKTPQENTHNLLHLKLDHMFVSRMGFWMRHVFLCQQNLFPSWWLNHSFEKYPRQIGSSPQGSGWKNNWNHHLLLMAEILHQLIGSFSHYL